METYIQRVVYSLDFFMEVNYEGLDGLLAGISGAVCVLCEEVLHGGPVDGGIVFELLEVGHVGWDCRENVLGMGTLRAVGHEKLYMYTIRS